MKLRKRKPTDQEEVEKVMKAFQEFIEKSNLEATLWVSVCLSTIANSYMTSDIPYEEFRSDMINAIIFYKGLWDKE